MAILNPRYEEIGKEFVTQYYVLFDDPLQRPNLIHLFNNEQSFMSVEGAQLQGSVKIAEKLATLTFQKINRAITSIDSQPTFDGGVLISVLGRLQVKLDYHTDVRQRPHIEDDKKISPISAEWDTNSPGPKVIVEVSEKAPVTISHTNLTNITTNVEAGPKIIVRTEEVLIVLAVLLLWIGAIALFFNRWGKIRMLEPYQPKFQQQHRSSCPLVEMEPQHKPSFSRVNMGMSLQFPPGRMGSISGPPTTSLYTTRPLPLYARNRQNSVFVEPQMVAQKPSRKYRSAIDIHSLVLDEAPEPV